MVCPVSNPVPGRPIYTNNINEDFTMSEIAKMTAQQAEKALEELEAAILKDGKVKSNVSKADKERYEALKARLAELEPEIEQGSNDSEAKPDEPKTDAEDVADTDQQSQEPGTDGTETGDDEEPAAKEIVRKGIGSKIDDHDLQAYATAKEIAKTIGMNLDECQTRIDLAVSEMTAIKNAGKPPKYSIYSMVLALWLGVQFQPPKPKVESKG